MIAVSAVQSAELCDGCAVQGGSYGSDQLRAILGAHGPVEDVVLLEQKKKSKASAVVVMATAAGAAAAAASRNGDPDNTLLIVPFLKACLRAKALAPVTNPSLYLNSPNHHYAGDACGCFSAYADRLSR